MTVARLESVARYVCEKSDWGVSNLRLQKLLYLTQMIHMGRTDGERLFRGDFGAWNYGPVEPTLYHKVKRFGDGAVDDVFVHARNFKNSDVRREVMDNVCDRFLQLSGGELIGITHWSQGAWAKNYRAGIRNTSIPDEDILNEYRLRTSPRGK